MCTIFDCLAYDDIDTTIRFDGRVVFLSLESKSQGTDIRVTLNPFQVRMLAKYLITALTQIDFADLIEEQNFGDLTVQIDQDTLEDYSLAVPF